MEQWLYDHSGHPPFLNDYGQIDLTRIRWDLETLPAGEFADVPTGASEHDTIDIYAAAPDHWIGVRNCGIHVGVAEMWTLYGTWKRWPVLIDRQLLSPPHPGLQVKSLRVATAMRVTAGVTPRSTSGSTRLC